VTYFYLSNFISNGLPPQVSCLFALGFPNVNISGYERGKLYEMKMGQDTKSLQLGCTSKEQNGHQLDWNFWKRCNIELEEEVERNLSTKTRSNPILRITIFSRGLVELVIYSGWFLACNFLYERVWETTECA
jgi:hypothetical protein